jgi:hypothetical protein
MVIIFVARDQYLTNSQVYCSLKPLCIHNVGYHMLKNNYALMLSAFLNIHISCKSLEACYHIRRYTTFYQLRKFWMWLTIWIGFRLLPYSAAAAILHKFWLPARLWRRQQYMNSDIIKVPNKATEYTRHWVQFARLMVSLWSSCDGVLRNTSDFDNFW